MSAETFTRYTLIDGTVIDRPPRDSRHTAGDLPTIVEVQLNVTRVTGTGAHKQLYKPVTFHMTLEDAEKLGLCVEIRASTHAPTLPETLLVELLQAIGVKFED